MHKHTIIVGLQHGDEAKARFVDWYVQEHKIKHVVRFNGGPNAGHTMVVNGVKYVTHGVPCGIINPGVKCYIGPGCVINPQKLLAEIQELKDLGISNIEARLKIDSRCHIITEEHIQRDIETEKTNPVGSTKQGIAPCYSDKYARKGTTILNSKIRELDRYIVGNVGEVLRNIPNYTEIVYEGAQGAMLDIDSHDYPNVTSSHCTAPYAMIGSGYGMMQNPKVIGVAKPYLTKVGTGYFPTSIEGTPLAEEIRAVGKEYGATTGRPRKIGWLNLKELKLACRLNGVTEIALFKNDVLRDIGKPVQVLLPSGEYVSVRYPMEATALCFLIEEHTGAKVKYFGVGPEREKLIVRE